MKTITFWIGPKSGEPAAVYPVEMRCNGLVKKAQIPKAEVDVEPVVQSPGSWRGRELGGEDHAGAGSAPNTQFGRWLYGLLFRGDIGQEWARMNDSGENSHCRFILDIEPDELRALRWEQMGQANIFPARLTNCSMIRGKDLDLKPSAVCDGPIRILVVVGSKAKDENVLAEQELEALEKAFTGETERVHLITLRQKSRTEIEAEYLRFKPHVFHFIGHGQLDGDGQPCLFVHNQLAATDESWTLARIDGELGKHAPAFVFLNACHTIDVSGKVLDASGRSESRQAVGSISEWFLTRIRARAVLGMHAAIRGDTAGQLSGALYRAILDGEALDVALTTARNRIDQLKGNDPARGWDWALPYLRVSVPPDQVLRMARELPLCVEQAASVSAFRNNGLFVDRVDERRKFLNAVQHDPKRSNQLLLIRGENLVGKTDLIRCCLMPAARRGRLIKHVELDPERGESFMGILRLFCQGVDDTLIGNPLPEVAMTKFYQTLNCLLDGQDPRDAGRLATYPTAAEWTRGGRLRQFPDEGGDQEQVKLLFAAFREALARVPLAAREDLARALREQNEEDSAAQVLADDRPFLIVLDQVSLSGINYDTFTKFLAPFLFKPFALGQVKGLVLVVAVKEEDYDTLTLKMNLAPEPIDLPKIEPEKFESLALEFFQKLCSLPKYRTRNVDHDRWKGNVKNLAESYKSRSEYWSPWVLKAMAGPYIGEPLK